jgi:hypothetical protein
MADRGNDERRRPVVSAHIGDGEPSGMRHIEIEVDGVTAKAILLEDKAPRTCAKIWDLLPIEDRTIQVRWSGAAWRTERNYPLALGEIENPVTVLEPGDIIYYDDPRHHLYKIGVAYGRAAWRDFTGDLSVAHVGRISSNLDALVAVCDRILYDGPKVVRIRRAR